MDELLAALAHLGTRVFQQPREPEQATCLALLPPLAVVALFGTQGLLERWRARRMARAPARRAGPSLQGP